MSGWTAIDASRAARPLRTGTERYSLELIRALLRQPGGRRYRLYLDRPPVADLFPSGGSSGGFWEVRVVGPPRLWSQLGLARALLQDRPGLLFVPAHVQPFLYQGRSVVTVHDVGYRWFPQAYAPAALAYLHLTTAWAAARATRLIVPSTAVALDLQRLYPRSRGRVRVVPEGVSADFQPVSRASADAVRARHGLSTPYVLALGTMQPRKNLVNALRGFNLLPASLRDTTTLALAGQPGRGQAVLRQEIERLDLTERVRLLGYVTDEDLPALYTGASALLFPSLHEGFGLPALEAMACGTPVLAARAAALPEVVGEAGLLFDPLDPAGLAAELARLLESPELRDRLGDTGRQRAAAFTWDRCASETATVLDEAHERRAEA